MIMESTNSNTLFTTMSNNIGQVSIENAQSEIDRLTKQTGRQWRSDNSPYLYVVDEIEDSLLNPCPLSEGSVWIVC
jgi:hypothetical protein